MTSRLGVPNCVRQCFITVDHFVHEHLHAEPKNMPRAEALISISVHCSAFSSMTMEIPHIGMLSFCKVSRIAGWEALHALSALTYSLTIWLT